MVVDVALVNWVDEDSQYFPPNVQPEWKDLYQPTGYGVLKPNESMWLKNPEYENDIQIATNSFGMRMPEAQIEKKPGVTRIAVVGDSVPFGWGLPAEKSFPYQLEELLKKESDATYEVLNFSAPGFTSHHVLKQYEQVVHNVQPDILIIAVGLYDSFQSRFSESELETLLREHRLIGEPSGLVQVWRSYSALGRWLHQRQLKRSYQEIDELLQTRIEQNEWKTKVDEADIVVFLSAIIDHHRRSNGQTILINTNLLNFYPQDSMRELADKFQLAFLDVRSVFEFLGQQQEKETYFQFDLNPSGYDFLIAPTSNLFLFRVYTPSLDPGKTMYIAGNTAELGYRISDATAMHDDGTHGDEIPGDKIWSFELTLPTPQSLVYTFVDDDIKNRWSSPSAAYENQWVNSQFYFQLKPPDLESNYIWRSPVWIYRKIPFDHLMQKTYPALPNETGQLVIAKRIEALIQRLREPS